MTLSFAVVKPLMLSWSTGRPWFLTVGSASSEEAYTMAYQLDDCVATLVSQFMMLPLVVKAM